MSTKPTPWYSIRRQPAPVAAAEPGAVSASSAEIMIYGDIGESWWDETVTARDFVSELASLDVDNITVRINSIGGSVPDGLAIYNAIRRHKATVTTVCDGMALSIASLILMAGDTVEMAENAMLMIHAPWTYAAGNSQHLREQADQLDKWAEAMATSYAAKTGRDASEMLALLTDGADHYLTAADALAGGFIDTVTTAVPPAAMAMAGNRFSQRAAAPAASAPPAAPAATSQEQNAMPMANQPAGASNPATPDAAAIQAAGIKMEADRRSGIKAAFQPFADREGVADLMAACEGDLQCSVDEANKKLLAHLAKGATPAAGGHIVTLEDERDKAVRAASKALMARAGLEKDDTANPVRAYSLFDLARDSVIRAGRKVDGLDKMGVVAVAFTHSTSDFPALLANVVQKALLKGAEEAEETFQLWTSEGTLGDFKPASRVGLGSLGSLPRVAEGAEYTFGTVGDRANQIVLAKYGRLLAITREAIINDDLSAFNRLPRAMGRAALRTVGDLVYNVLTGNPVLAEDNKALFHADHGNIRTGASVTTDSVQAMRTAMARQKLPGQTSGGSNIRLAHVIVPVSLEGVANVVRNSEFEVGASAKNNTVPNSVRNTFEVVSDARLDDASTTAWYGAASAALHDTIEVAYLDGNKLPTLEQKAGWTVDGVEFKVRMEAGVAPLDFRALQRNPGA